MVSLSFECYAYEHGAEIGMWISVNLDLLLYIVYCTVALTWPTPRCTWGWILVIVVIACWLNFVNILKTILLLFYFLPNNPWRFCLRIEARNSMLSILHTINIIFNCMMSHYHKHNPLVQIVWELYTHTLGSLPAYCIAGQHIWGLRCHWSTFG